MYKLKLDEGVFAIEKLLRQSPGRRTTFIRKGMELDWARYCYAELFALLGLLVLIILRQ